MHSKSIVVLCVAFVISLVTTGCSPSPTLIGRWQEVGSKDGLEFMTDGRVMLQTEKGLLAGRFEIQEKNRVILKVDVGFGQQVNLVLSYRFEEAQLFLTDESKGNSSRYVRINSGSPAPTTVPPSAGTMPPAPQTVRQGTVQTLKRDVQADVLRNLRLFAAAADQYFLENGVSQTTYDQLVGPDKYIKQVTAVDGENYRNLVLKQGHELRVTTASGLTVRYAP